MFTRKETSTPLSHTRELYFKHMSTEIEVKILEIDPLSLIAKIESFGGKCLGDWLIYTTIYDFPDRKLLSKGGYVRIRNEGPVWHCTYKSKITQDSAKKMLELDMQVNDPEIADQILKALGLQEVLFFEKRRRHYVSGPIIFDIDQLPGIPPFLEIEAPSQEEVEAGMEILKIDRKKALSIGPKELLAHYGIDIDKIRELRFPNPGKKAPLDPIQF